MKRNCVVCSTELTGIKKMYCGNTCKQKHHWHRVKEQQNTYHSQTLRGWKRKLEFVILKGGCCEVCGYKKNLASLHFHHRDPNEKELRLDLRSLSNNSYDKLKNEVEKCDLLCGNCHHEEHHPECTFEIIERMLHGVIGKKSPNENGVNSGKP